MQIIENYLRVICSKDIEVFDEQALGDIAKGAGQVVGGVAKVGGGLYQILKGIIGGPAIPYIAQLGLAFAFGALVRELLMRRKHCKQLEGGRYWRCYLDAKYRTYVTKIDLLEKGIDKCDRTDNPVKCRKILQTELDEARGEAAKLRGER